MADVFKTIGYIFDVKDLASSKAMKVSKIVSAATKEISKSIEVVIVKLTKLKSSFDVASKSSDNYVKISGRLAKVDVTKLTPKTAISAAAKVIPKVETAALPSGAAAKTTATANNAPKQLFNELINKTIKEITPRLTKLKAIFTKEIFKSIDALVIKLTKLKASFDAAAKSSDSYIKESGRLSKIDDVAVPTPKSVAIPPAIPTPKSVAIPPSTMPLAVRATIQPTAPLAARVMPSQEKIPPSAQGIIDLIVSIEAVTRGIADVISRIDKSIVKLISISETAIEIALAALAQPGRVGIGQPRPPQPRQPDLINQTLKEVVVGPRRLFGLLEGKLLKTISKTTKEERKDGFILRTVEENIRGQRRLFGLMQGKLLESATTKSVLHPTSRRVISQEKTSFKPPEKKGGSLGGLMGLAGLAKLAGPLIIIAGVVKLLDRILGPLIETISIAFSNALGPLDMLIEIIGQNLIPIINQLMKPIVTFLTIITAALADKLFKWLNKIVTQVTAFNILPFIDTVISFIDPVMNFLSGAMDLLVKIGKINFKITLIAWKLLLGAISAFWPIIKPIAKALMWVVNLIVDEAMRILDVISAAVSGLVSIWEWAISGVVDIISGFVNIVSGAVDAIFELFTFKGLTNIIFGIFNRVNANIKLIVDTISSLAGSISGIFGNILTGLEMLLDSARQGVSAFAAYIMELLSSAVGFITDKITSLLDIDIPLIGKLSNIPLPKSLLPFANGGIVTGPTRALIGEAGPEMVLPLKPETVTQYLQPVLGKMEMAGVSKIVDELRSIDNILSGILNVRVTNPEMNNTSANAQPGRSREEFDLGLAVSFKGATGGW